MVVRKTFTAEFEMMKKDAQKIMNNFLETEYETSGFTLSGEKQLKVGKILNIKINDTKFIKYEIISKTKNKIYEDTFDYKLKRINDIK